MLEEQEDTEEHPEVLQLLSIFEKFILINSFSSQIQQILRMK